ncbi:N-acetylmuramoyl-L-alanine amidase [Natronohydrobacter thiooxidans]|uniref:N-acetylmuramoyl-L-alanine amidase n=1 Tax=Natronohydrobacter thiooxidans TaxID=87172 RepID=UPI0009FC08AB|nr:N-acetylmuramoyl-L-alanine amidase [Natronohydrobacter thiooxidans]
MQPLWHPSPNFGPRRAGLIPSIVVLHYTGMRGAADALDRLCDPSAEVSAHYMIGSCGTLWQLVAEEMRAWHAGAGAWQGAADVNSRSIGIELVNTGAQPFPEAQISVLEQLLRAVMARWSIPAHGVIAHSDMAPERKEDPGPRFDWARLARQGLALWPEGFGADAPLGDSLDAIGYPPAEAAKRLQAFRYRFLPAGQGPETETDRRRADCVARAMRQLS